MSSIETLNLRIFNGHWQDWKLHLLLLTQASLRPIFLVKRLNILPQILKYLVRPSAQASMVILDFVGCTEIVALQKVADHEVE